MHRYDESSQQNQILFSKLCVQYKELPVLRDLYYM